MSLTSESGELRYGDYLFPAWAKTVGWMIWLSSVLAIPIYPVINVLMAKGTLDQVSYWRFWVWCTEIVKISLYSYLSTQPR